MRNNYWVLSIPGTIPGTDEGGKTLYPCEPYILLVEETENQNGV